MPDPRRVVYEIQRIHDLIRYILYHHKAPSTLIVCSTQDAFIEALQAEKDKPAADGSLEDMTRFWKEPTLRLLSTSQTLKFAFCPDITHLRAYLATHNSTVSEREPEPETALRLPDAVPMLVILDPVRAHSLTSAYSAQGLNRTFSAAVEAAYHTGSKLILSESPALPEPSIDGMEVEEPGKPWDVELSILNITTKRLGDMSVGRTVKARTVASRWCVFENLPEFGF